jgi:hypothetical protein
MIPRALLKVGDTLALVSKHTWRDYLPRALPKTMLHKAIQFYQGRMFPNGVTDEVHVLRYLGLGALGFPTTFEVTNPVARIGDLSALDALIDKGWTVRVYRYQKYLWQPVDEPLLREIVAPMVGRKYDYLDLLPFVLETVIGFASGTYNLLTSLFGARWKDLLYYLGRISPQTFVCSSGNAAIDVAMHKRKSEFFPRPFQNPDGTDTFIEKVCPAFYANWRGDFSKVWSSD